MGKKKDKYRYDKYVDGIDFDDPNSIQQMLQDLGVADDGAVCSVPQPPTTKGGGIDVDSIAARMAGGTPVPRSSVDKTSTPQPKAPRTPSREGKQVPTTGLSVRMEKHPYGSSQCGVSIYKRVAGVITDSIMLPLYVNEGHGERTFDTNLADLEERDLVQCFYDAALMTVLRCAPDAVYPYTPEGVEKLTNLVSSIDPEDIVVAAVGNALQCYDVSQQTLKAQFVSPIVVEVLSKCGFSADRLLLLYALMPCGENNFGPCRIVYDEDICAGINASFESIMRAKSQPRTVDAQPIDLSSIIVDPDDLLNSLTDDILFTLSSKLSKHIPSEYDSDEVVGDEDGEEDYEEEEPEEEFAPPYEIETLGGASNDNAPFPTDGDDSGDNQQGAITSRTDDAVAHQEVHQFDSTNANQRRYQSPGLGTTIGSVLESSGIIPSTNGSADGGRGQTSSGSNENKEPKIAVPDVGRGSDVGESKQKVEEKEIKKEVKEETSSDMVVSITTVGR